MKRKFISCIVCLAVILIAALFLPNKVSAATVAIGTCGANLTWTLNDAGTLTISGNGTMDDFIYDTYSPWYEKRSQIKAVVIGNSVTSIGDYAFYSCNNLINVTIPNVVTSIGNDAFRDCRSLTSITIPDSVTTIGDGAFYSCNNLTNVTIPNGVTSIGNHTFSDCINLSTVLIPDSITSIGSDAFNNCNSLIYNRYGNGKYLGNSKNPYVALLDVTSTSITSCEIAPKTRVIVRAFYDCTSLFSVTIPNSVVSIGNYAFYNCTNLYSVTIPNNVTSIGFCAFANCTKLIDITIPTSVNAINSSAFAGCTSLINVTILEGVTSIGGSSFSGCTNLNSITIPDSVINIDIWAFYNCTNLTNIIIGDNVTNIGPGAFQKCINVINISIPESVTTIGHQAFSGCSSLTSVTIGDGVTSIGEHAFYDCNSLTSIAIPDSITSIGSDAFSKCSRLNYNTKGEGIYLGNNENPYVVLIDITNISINSFEIPNVCKVIYNSAFSSCSNLTSIVIPDSVTGIGNYAFSHCRKLAFINIPKSVTSIGNGVFSSCSNLTSIIIPDSVTSIGGYAFNDCTSLTSITIPDSVTTIGYNTFYNCTGLSHVAYAGTQEQWQSITDGNDHSDLTSAEFFHFGATIYWTKNCVNAGLYCTGCDDFLSREREDDGTHSYSDILDFSCNDCDYIRYIKKVSIHQLPTKLEYVYGKDTLDISGGVLLLSYSDGVTCYLDMNPDMISGFDNTTIGNQSLTVTVNELKTSYIVTVVLGTPNLLTIDHLPDKRIYYPGEQLDLTGLSVTAHYANHHTVSLSISDLTIAPVDMSTLGAKTVTVSYDGVSINFDIYVHSTISEMVDSCLYPESSHNYVSNTNETQVFTYPNAVQLILTFNSSSYTESNYDFLCILDGEGKEIGKYSGSLAEMTVTIPGDTVQLCLVSDSSVNKYGYAFSSIVATIIDYVPQTIAGVSPTLSSPGYSEGKVCQCCGIILEEPQEIPKLEGRVAQWNVSLDDDFRTNFYLEISQELFSSAQVKISAGNHTILLNVCELTVSDGYYLTSMEIAAAQMNDDITIQVLNGEDQGEIFSYTIREYCNEILDNPEHSAYHGLVWEMLNYGAMAQIYFDYDTEYLANDGVTGVANAEIPETADEMIISDKITDLSFYGASLVYRDRIAVRYYFTGDVTDCTFTANGNTYTPVAKDGMYYVEIADILPQNLDLQITLTITDAGGNTLTVTYGPMNYIVRMNQKESENLKNLLKALYNYHLAAKALQSA